MVQLCEQKFLYRNDRLLYTFFRFFKMKFSLCCILWMFAVASVYFQKFHCFSNCPINFKNVDDDVSYFLFLINRILIPILPRHNTIIRNYSILAAIKINHSQKLLNSWDISNHRKHRISGCGHGNTSHHSTVYKLNKVNPFLASVPILYSRKIPENQRFSGVFRRYKMGKFVRNGLIKQRSWVVSSDNIPFKLSR